MDIGIAAESGSRRPELCSVRSRRMILAVILTFGSLVLFAPRASAVISHPVLPFSPITGTGTGVKLHFLEGVAVDESSGNVFVNDGVLNGGVLGAGGGFVDIFGGEGGIPTGLVSPYRITTEPPFTFEETQSAAAVDNSPTSSARGTLYVDEAFGEASRNGAVRRFTRNPVTEKYEPQGKLNPASPFEQPADMAVDTRGNVFVADGAHRRVVEFSPAGTEIASIDVSQFAGEPKEIAVDAAGDLFIGGSKGGGRTYWKYPANGLGVIDPGTAIEIIPKAKTQTAGLEAGGMAVDPTRNLLFLVIGGHIDVFDTTSEEADPQPLLEFGQGILEPIELGVFGNPKMYFYSRIAVNSASERIYVTGASPKQVLAFGYGPKLPTLRLGTASGTNSTTENLAATVNPGGEAVTECDFEYGKTTAYGSTAPCSGSIPTDESDHPVSATITGLTPSTPYHFRIVAANVNGGNHSIDGTFTTLPPDRAITEPANQVARTKATLNGTVFPEEKLIEECIFEYGIEGEGLGETASCSPGAASIPADHEGHAVAAALTGLQPSKSYEFRVSTESELGPAEGKVLTFTTGEVAVTEPASTIGGAKATLNATVFPESKAVTECFFEYGRTTAYGSTVPCEGSIPIDETGHVVSAQVSNLVPDGTVYHFRIVTNGGYGKQTGRDASFATANTIITTAPTEISGSGFTANGTVNPEEVPVTECLFEYGKTLSYGKSAPCEVPTAGEVHGNAPVAVHAKISGLEASVTYHYRLVAMGAEGGDQTAKTAGPPTVVEAWVQGVLTTAAELQAKINPEGFPATYRIEYGTTQSYGQSTPEAEVGSNNQPHIVTDQLRGLAPGTVYHWRVVAKSGQGTMADKDHVLHTYALGSEAGCPNQQFRSGPSAGLPDCRAYEMVSPVDKEGGEVRVLGREGDLLPAVLRQAAADGDKLAYGSNTAYGGARSGAYTTQYVATRHAGEGWVGHPISPPHERSIAGTFLQGNPEFQAFSTDLCAGWLSSVAEPPLAPGAPSGSVNLYRRQDDECGGSGYEALNTMAPTVVPQGLQLELQGLSSDGQTAIFDANRQLTEDAGTGTFPQLYGTQSGQERYLCILPDKSPLDAPCQAGTSDPFELHGFGDWVGNALSTDGRRVYWTAMANNLESGPGRIYLRENPFAAGAECTSEASACTLDVSKGAEEAAGADNEGSRFWAAAADGSRAIFSTRITGQGETLYDYRLADRSAEPIAGEVTGVMGVSNDASRIYLVSHENLSGPNAEGKSPTAKGLNLYLYEVGKAGGQGSFRFVGELASGDSVDFLAGASPISTRLGKHYSRVSADGKTAVFMSYSRLTGYDNTDRSSGEADSEVFRYDAAANSGGGGLLCVSCNPSGARPVGHERKITPDDQSGPWTAGQIQGLESDLHAQRVLSDNGNRVFFESTDPLVLADTNAAQDVYEWEVPGEGTCTPSAPTYSPLNGGCVSLISSGKSPVDSEFTEADPSGRNVFFVTLASLVPWDPGVLDVYDAREEGGLPAPPSLPPSCEGEVCQPAPSAPSDPTPASSAFAGAGNAREGRPRSQHKHKKHKKSRHKHKGRNKKGRPHGHDRRSHR